MAFCEFFILCPCRDNHGKNQERAYTNTIHPQIITHYAITKSTIAMRLERAIVKYKMTTKSKMVYIGFSEIFQAGRYNCLMTNTTFQRLVVVKR